MKLFRSILDNDIWFEEPFTRAQAWVDLLLIANHKDGVIRVRGNKIKIKRGQVGWSQKRLADRWKWSRGKVSRFLQELEETERQIEQQKNPITTLITIINYEKYNGDGQQADSRQTADGQQTDTNKKVNKVENEKKEEIKALSLSCFEKAWKEYPERDGNKKKTGEKICRQLKSEDDINNLQTALKNYLKHVEIERACGFSGLRYQNRQTWFNNWQNWIEWEPTKSTNGQEPNQEPEDYSQYREAIPK